MGEASVTDRSEPQAVNDFVVKQVVPALCAVAMLFAGIVGARVLSQQDEIAKSVEQMKVDVAVVKVNLEYLKEEKIARVNRD